MSAAAAKSDMPMSCRYSVRNTCAHANPSQVWTGSPTSSGIECHVEAPAQWSVAFTAAQVPASILTIAVQGMEPKMPCTPQ